MFDIEEITNLILCLNPKMSVMEEIYASYFDDYSHDFLIFDSKEENEIFKQIISLVYTEDIQRNFSEKEFKKLISNIIFDSYNYKNFSDRKKNIEDNLKLLNNDLKNKINKEWAFFIPLKNIKIDEKIVLSNVEIAKYGDFEDEIINLNNICLENDYPLPSFLSEEEYKCMVFAKVLRRGMPKFTLIDAYNDVELALSILNLFKYSSELPISTDNGNYRFFKYYFSYAGENLLETSYLDDKRFDYNLSNDRLEEIKKLGLNILIDIFNKNSKTEMENRLLKSIFFYNKANQSYINFVDDFYYEKSEDPLENLKYNRLIDAYIFLFTSLETLLINKNCKKIKDKLSKRCSRLCFDKYEKRASLKNEIVNSYEKRSELIHNADLFIDFDEVFKMKKINRHCIFIMLYSILFQHLENSSDLSDFFNSINMDTDYLKRLKEFVEKNNF